MSKIKKYRIYRSTLLRLFLGGGLSGLVFHYAAGTSLLWATLAGVALLWAEDLLDPFHRYKRAVYCPMMTNSSGAPRGMAVAHVHVLYEMEEGFYRVRFPIWWKLMRTYRRYLPKDAVTLID